MGKHTGRHAPSSRHQSPPARSQTGRRAHRELDPKTPPPLLAEPEVAVTPAPTRAARRRDRRRRRHRNTIIAAVCVVTLAVSGTVLAALKLNSNINRVDLTQQLGVRPARDAGPQQPVNILVMGSDTRKGIGTTKYGKDTIEGGAHSDTNLLVHLSADRSRAYVVSIPRDSMTKAPADCKDPSARVEDGPIRQWNQNFHEGGPGCTIRTLEGVTGVYVDHFVVLDFRGFQEMVDALGGVDVCLPQAIDDKDAHLSLPAGKQRLKGEEALGYVRVRKTVGDGSDIGRIDRQQAFMSSVVQEATKTSLLMRPDKLYSFLDAGTKSMTADKDLGITTMVDIADSVKDLGADKVTFVTVPTQTYAPDPNRVEWTPAADELWAAIRNDQPLPGEKVKPKPEKKPLTVTPDKISVTVHNDTTAKGLAAQEAKALEIQGFTASVSHEPGRGDTTGVVVRYNPKKSGSARTVAAAYKGATLVPDASLPASSIEVWLGNGAPNAREVPNRLGTQKIPEPAIVSPAAVEAAPLETRSADTNICS